MSSIRDGSRRSNWVAKQDVDIIDVGHYTPATKADEAALRTYMVNLHQQVLDLVRSGQAWDQLYRNVKFSDEVTKWTAFDTMKTLNILGMYRWVSNHRRGERPAPYYSPPVTYSPRVGGGFSPYFSIL